MVKEKPQVSAPAVVSEPVGDMQYSVRTDNKFAGVEDGNEDPIELLEKLNLEAKAPKEKKVGFIFFIFLLNIFKFNTFN